MNTPAATPAPFTELPKKAKSPKEDKATKAHRKFLAGLEAENKQIDDARAALDAKQAKLKRSITSTKELLGETEPEK